MSHALDLPTEREVRRTMLTRGAYWCALRLLARCDDVRGAFAFALAVATLPAEDAIPVPSAVRWYDESRAADEAVERYEQELHHHALAIAGADERGAPLDAAIKTSERLADARRIAQGERSWMS